MDWSHFIFYGAAAAICWIAGAVAAYRSEGVRPAAVLSLCGSAIFLVFITGLWISLERPPMRTVGETRLWSCPLQGPLSSSGGATGGYSCSAASCPLCLSV